MVSNIESIKVWLDNPRASNQVPIVRIKFKFPCDYTVLSLDDLKQLFRCFIQGEEMRYPLANGFQGRYLLLGELMKVFNEDIINEKKSYVERGIKV